MLFVPLPMGESNHKPYLKPTSPFSQNAEPENLLASVLTGHVVQKVVLFASFMLALCRHGAVSRSH